MSDETKIFTKNDKNGDKCASGGQESGLKLIFERGVAILVRPWRFPGQPKKFVFFSIKVGTINSGTSLDSREQFKKTGKLEQTKEQQRTKGNNHANKNKQVWKDFHLDRASRRDCNYCSSCQYAASCLCQSPQFGSVGCLHEQSQTAGKRFFSLCRRL